MVVALFVAQAIAAAHVAFAQQLAGAFEVALTVVGVDQRRQGVVVAIGQGPAQQRQQAGAEERRVQRAVDVALHVDNGR